MKLECIPTKNEGKAKKTIYAGIGLVGLLLIAGIMLTIFPLDIGLASASADIKPSYNGAAAASVPGQMQSALLARPIMRNTTNADRLAAAARAMAARKASASRISIAANVVTTAALTPGGTPDYFGTTPNYANSPLPVINPTGIVSGGIRKFVDSLPGLTPAGANNLGKYIPIAVADTTSYAGNLTTPAADYYEIGLVDYTEKMHSDLNNTTLRGYVQLETPVIAAIPGASKHVPLKYLNGTNITNATGAQVFGVDIPHYLGPLVIATKNRPVRVKFINFLPPGAGGNLFIPTDTTVMGAGMGPLYPNGSSCNPNVAGAMCANYSQNRATLHLHGGNTPWISDGTMHQWTTPAGENTVYPKGVSVRNVPDMDGGIEPQGTLTFYYTNQQSARLMFYHDHAYGLTRLGVYAGEAAGYLETDPVEQGLITQGILPGVGIPLIIQDKSYLPDAATLATQDPTWPFALDANKSNLWYPHVYMPNQNPAPAMGGANAMGRWDYSLWIWPFLTPSKGPVPNPLYNPITAPWENSVNPGTPNPSIVPEAFMDTPVVNGNAYPNLPLGQKAYRFRILDAANDRMLNLQLYYAWTAGPFIIFSGGGGSGAQAMATVTANGSIAGITIGSGGMGYVTPPSVSIFDAPGHTPRGSGATATATITGSVISIAVINGGTGYTTAPNVSITGGGGTGATALAILNLTGSISSITVTNGGINYNSTPVVNISGGRGTGAIANATISTVVNKITVTNGGTGYAIPTECRGTAVANKSLCTEVSMVPATPNAAIPFPQTWMAQFGGAYDILDGRVGGVPNPASIGPTMYQIGTEGGFLPNVAVIENKPVGWDHNTRSITIGNVLEKALWVGPAERADVIVDFSGVPDGSTLILYNDAPAPVPAFDTRYDYYTGDPDNTATGGAPTTLPGYGPNTRTVMQIQVNRTLGNATAYNVAALQTALPAAYGSSQDKPIIPEYRYNTAFGANYPLDPYIRIQDIAANFTPAGSGTPVSLELNPKSIVEDFDMDYGRMNAMLGTELLLRNPNITLAQTTIPYYDVDPPTEIIKNSDAAALIGTLGDGTQVWKITHNGVDTHAIHWHMFNVQLIDRVGWDGSIRPPNDNEIGWKDTVILNPLEDAFIALRPIKPNVPWDLPNSVRALDVTSPLGVAMPNQFHNQDPLGNPATVVNHEINYGWEYVWHCHILGHEENIMMRPIAFVVTPHAPMNLAATTTNNGVVLTWTDNSTDETGFIIQRATASTGPWTTVTTVPSITEPGKGATVAGIDPTGNPAYFYTVMATNVVGDTTVYSAPAAGYPSMSANSTQSNVVQSTTSAVQASNPGANPEVILNDNGRPRVPGTNISRLNVTVTGSVAGVTVDLRPIGGPAAAPMTLLSGSANIYTITTNAVAGINLNNTLTVTVNGLDGSTSTVNIPLTVLRRGDVVRDNVVDANDALYILRSTVGLVPAPSVLVGDVTGDSKVDATDALYIMRYTVGLEVAP